LLEAAFIAVLAVIRYFCVNGFVEVNRDKRRKGGVIEKFALFVSKSSSKTSSIGVDAY